MENKNSLTSHKSEHHRDDVKNRTFISLASAHRALQKSVNHYIELCMSELLKNNDIILRLNLHPRLRLFPFFSYLEFENKLKIFSWKSLFWNNTSSTLSEPLRNIAVDKSPELQKLICHKCLRNCENSRQRNSSRQLALRIAQHEAHFRQRIMTGEAFEDRAVFIVCWEI